MYGLQNEGSSRTRLSKILKKEIKKAGLFIDEKYEFLGASLDGTIDDDGKVELKNPISAANITPLQAMKKSQV